MTTTRYIGTKIIQAKPMTRQAYNDLRGWALPADEDGNDAGFLVEYEDGGKANVPGFAGYVRWSPADVFQRAYKPLAGDGLPAHQQRVVQEQEELDEKREKLTAFYSTPIFHGLPESEQTRLLRQGVVMRDYSDILGERIKTFSA